MAVLLTERPTSTAAAVDASSAAAAPAASATAASAAAAAAPPTTSGRVLERACGVAYRQYVDERDLPAVMALIDRDLPEPYSIFTYRYFLLQWPHLCFIAHDDGGGGGDEGGGGTEEGGGGGGGEGGSSSNSSGGGGGGGCGGKPIGVIVCKMDVHRGKQMRGYVAMLAVDSAHRGKGIGSRLGRMAIRAMVEGGAEEVALEAEATNGGALALYRALGFVRDKRLHRYYLAGTDAYRLKLQLPLTEAHATRRARERNAIMGLPAEEGMAVEGGAEGEAAEGLDALGELPPADEGLIA